MFRRALLALLLVLGVTACLSPTLPLPPPEAPSQSLGSQPGTVHLSSVKGVQPDAFVFIENKSVNQPGQAGIVVKSDSAGTWQADVQAVYGDSLVIWYESNTKTSPSITVTVTVQ